MMNKKSCHPKNDSTELVSLPKQTLTPFLLTYFENTLTLNGQEIAPTSYPILLAPLKQNEYRFVESEHELKKSSQSILLDSIASKIAISTSWFGEYQLFYYIDSSNLLVCSSYETAVDFLRARSIALEVDEVAVWEYLVFEHPLRSRTLCRQIKKIMLGKKMEFSLKPLSLKITSSYTLRYSDSYGSSDEEKLTAQATEILSSLITPEIHQILRGKRVLLLLSGGVDSRLIGALLKKNDIPFECITYGPWESAESYMAKRVANALGSKITHLLLEDTDYKNFGDEVTTLSGGMSFHMHCASYSVLKKNGLAFDYILHGNLAERSLATATDLPPGTWLTKDQAMQDVLAYKSRTTRTWTLVPDAIRQEILVDLWETMEECSTINSPRHFYDYFSKVESNSFVYSSIFNVIQSFGIPFSPYANEDFQEFFCSLPTKFREEKHLFSKACKKLFPKEFSIGTPDTIFEYNPLLKLIEQGFSKALNAVSFGAFIVSGGRVWLPNPKNFERHRKVAFEVLRNDLLKSIDYLSAMLNVDLSSLGKASYANRLAVKDQFTILASYVVIKHFGLASR